MRRVLIAGGIGLLGLWAAACAALLVFRHDLIYPFMPDLDARASVGVPGANATIFAGDDGTALIAWLAEPRPGRPVVLYFKGNAGALVMAGPRLAEFVHRGYGVAALNYRGAGGAPGQPGEAVLTADALALYDRLDALLGEALPPSRRVIYGTSLGAAVAVQLAARREAAAVILETPFARLCETAEHHYPLIPACTIMWDERWASADAIAEIRAPILIQHGDADRIVPLAQAERLYRAAAEPKTLRVYPGGRHNDLRLHGAGSDAIAWLEGLGL